METRVMGKDKLFYTTTTYLLHLRISMGCLDRKRLFRVTMLDPSQGFMILGESLEILELPRWYFLQSSVDADEPFTLKIGQLAWESSTVHRTEYLEMVKGPFPTGISHGASLFWPYRSNSSHRPLITKLPVALCAQARSEDGMPLHTLAFAWARRKTGVKDLLAVRFATMMPRWVHCCGKLRGMSRAYLAGHTSPDPIDPHKFQTRRASSKNNVLVIEELILLLIGCEVLGSFSINNLKSNSWRAENPSEQSRLAILFCKEDSYGRTCRSVVRLCFNQVLTSIVVGRKVFSHDVAPKTAPMAEIALASHISSNGKVQFGAIQDWKLPNNDGQLVVALQKCILEMGRQFLEFNLGRFMNGRFNGFSFTEVELFPTSRHILFMIWEWGWWLLSKLLLEAGCPPQDHSRKDYMLDNPVRLLDQGKSRLLREAGNHYPQMELGVERK
ncbi:hypothetical protein Tco_0243405 [Tanacetum coccineum]